MRGRAAPAVRGSREASGPHLGGQLAAARRDIWNSGGLAADGQRGKDRGSGTHPEDA